MSGMRPENPWRGPTFGGQQPEWCMRRRLTSFRVECPECGAIGRGFVVGPQTRDVRCSYCNFRFDPAGRCPPTSGKDKR